MSLRSSLETVTRLADRLGMARPTVARWVEGQTPPVAMQSLIAKIGACPCILEEKPICGDCWHFGNHKTKCRFCGQGK